MEKNNVIYKTIKHNLLLIQLEFIFSFLKNI